jgi:hypothetical protein
VVVTAVVPAMARFKNSLKRLTMVHEQINRAKALREELFAELLDKNSEFYVYTRTQPRERKINAERSLWSSSLKFRTWYALGEALAGYEQVM